MPTKPRIIACRGESLTLKQWAERTGIHAETIRCRIDHLGWSVEQALETTTDLRFAGTGGVSMGEPRPCPRMKRHKGTGQAYARWQERGKKHFRYFGPWKSKEAMTGYHRFQLEWLAGSAAAKPKPGQVVAVDELIEGYLQHVNKYYRKDGKPTSERERHYAACRVLNTLYGSLPVTEFGPDCLRACVQEMIGKGWTRNTINQHQWRLVKCFRWGVGQQLVPPDVHLTLKAVEYLQSGRTTAPDKPPVKPVPSSDLEKILKHLHADPGRQAVLEAMIRFHALTGMRPGELCAMRPCDLDLNGDAWRYTVRPEINKNQHRDQPQRYWIGPKGQAILKPFLDAAGPTERVWVFPPRGKTAKRGTAVSRGSYGEFVRLACDEAGVDRWHPHQLRHSRATEVQRHYESNAMAAAAIGDSVEVASTVYIDPADAVRRRIALEMG